MAVHHGATAQLMCRSSALLLLPLAMIGGCGAANDTGNLVDCRANMAFEGELDPSLEHAVTAAVISASTDLGQLRSLPEHEAMRLDEAFVEVTRQHDTIQEASAAVLLDGGQVWSTGQTDRFWWGSVGKTFTAMAVLQLVDEGKLDLTTPASRFAPYIPHAGSMTVLNLLSHTAGLYNFTRGSHAHTTAYRHPNELIALSVLHGPDWCIQTPVTSSSERSSSK
jgi:CubicO group peptidase (beta-lactamase class C family)